MAARDPADIRNITLTGSSSVGKTTLVERMLVRAGVIGRMGSVQEGNTVSDWTDEEKSHQHSLAATPIYFEHDGKLINIIDTPGLADFGGHAIAAMPASEVVAIVIEAGRGIDSVTRRLMNVAAERRIPRMIIINRIEDQQADLEALVGRIREMFGSVCLPINLPADGATKVIGVFEDGASGSPDFSSVEDAHTQIIEQVVEVDEDLMATYLETGGEGLDKARVHAAFTQALREAHLVPICFTSAAQDVGVKELLDLIVEQCPSPREANPRTFLRGEEEVFPEPDPGKPLIAHIFKVASDPFVGKLGAFKIHQGTLRAKDEVYINDEKKPIRIGHIFRVRGKEHVEIDAAGPGDIAAISKIEEISFNATLHGEPGDTLRLRPLPLPKPMYGLAIELTNHKDESKFSGAYAKLAAEDPCFTVERIAATKQTVARGLGELHLRVILEKLKDQFGIAVETSPPKIAYKETIRGNAEGHHRHKKQTGGAGQFGEVYLRVAPLPPEHETGFEFENATVGGSIPKNFMPAIEKGIRQALTEGALAGYPFRGVRVEVYDGKYHPVDSKEVAFMTAGKRAFVDAVKKAKPTLLEPFVELEITAPEQYLGDITGDLSTKRGRVIDTIMDGAGSCVVRASAPLGEVQNYSNELKSMTGGAGGFTMDDSHDEPTPPHIQEAVVAAYKPHEED
ncbi:MAG: elongation factor G [Phycisphaerales bacterium JB039]